MALDYRDVVSHRERPSKKRGDAPIQPRWWELEEGEMARSVMDNGMSMKMNSENRITAMVRHARMYENCELDGLGSRNFSNAVVQQLISGAGLMSLNVGASCVDTLLAKVTKNRPRPRFLTSGGSWTSQIKARNLEKWCQGYFYETKVHQKLRHSVLDGYTFGTGLLYVFEDGLNDKRRLACERVLASEIYVDDLDGQYGEPQQMFRRKLVSKDILIRLFPKQADEIVEAGKAGEDATGDEGVSDTTVEIWEAWHLPSGDDADDGKHVIAVDGCLLLCEPWKIRRFPFVVTRFKKRTTGFWGKGVIETVQGIQVELNRTVKSISQQLKRKGKGRTYVQIGSKVNPSHMTNADGGDIVYYTGERPHDAAVNVVSPEEFAYVQQLRQQAFQEVGISELSAASKKPSGLDAAVALREYSDIESERFAMQHQDLEQAVLDFAELSIDLITKQYGWDSYKVLVPGRRDLLEVDWKDVDLGDDAYVMQMYPVSSLPQTPGAKLQRVEELKAGGYIDMTVAKRLLDFPDIESEGNLGNAMLDDCDATISAILDDEKPRLIPLEPYQNLDLMIQRANAAYLYARHRNCPEDRLSMLRNLIDNATASKAAAMAPPPMDPMAMGAGAPPGAPPMGGPPMGGGAQINNTLNVPPPIIPTVPPIVGG